MNGEDKEIIKAKPKRIERIKVKIAKFMTILTNGNGISKIETSHSPAPVSDCSVDETITHAHFAKKPA